MFSGYSEEKDLFIFSFPSSNLHVNGNQKQQQEHGRYCAAVCLSYDSLGPPRRNRDEGPRLVVPGSSLFLCHEKAVCASSQTSHQLRRRIIALLMRRTFGKNTRAENSVPFVSQKRSPLGLVYCMEVQRMSAIIPYV